MVRHPLGVSVVNLIHLKLLVGLLRTESPLQSADELNILFPPQGSGVDVSLEAMHAMVDKEALTIHRITCHVY